MSENMHFALISDFKNAFLTFFSIDLSKIVKKSLVLNPSYVSSQLRFGFALNFCHFYYLF